MVEALDPGVYRELVRRGLAEDLGWGDVTTTALVGHGTRATGRLVAVDAVVLAGTDIALEVFRQLDPGVRIVSRHADGDRCEAGATLAQVEGLASALLTGERTALNFLRHLSGIATFTRALVDEADGRWLVGDTRKTLPLLRAIEKYAVRVGGGQNGRLALDDGLIIKRNHARVAGGIATAVARARAAHPELPVQVEVATADEAHEAIEAGAPFVLCSASGTADLVALIEWCAGRARVEVSGLPTPEARRAAAAAGADYLSIGWLADAAPALDIRLDLDVA